MCGGPYLASLLLGFEISREFPLPIPRHSVTDMDIRQMMLSD